MKTLVLNHLREGKSLKEALSLVGLSYIPSHFCLPVDCTDLELNGFVALAIETFFYNEAVSEIANLTLYNFVREVCKDKKELLHVSRGKRISDVTGLSKYLKDVTGYPLNVLSEVRIPERRTRSITFSDW